MTKKKEKEYQEHIAALEAKIEALEENNSELNDSLNWCIERKEFYFEKNNFYEKRLDKLERVLSIKNERIEELRAEIDRLSGNGPLHCELIKIVCGEDGYEEYRVMFPKLSDYELLELLLKAKREETKSGYQLKDIAEKG